MIQRILALAAGFLVVATVGGWGHEHRPASAEQPAAARAVRALTSGAPNALALLPADFAAVEGYEPVAAPGGPLRADGGCSSPFGGTTYGFGDDCKRHDLGYDLLRYAEAKDRPLGPWARHAIDARFAHQTRARCGHFTPGCRAAAWTYGAAVDFNSWRQGWGVPVVEPVSSFALPIGAGLGAAALLGAAGSVSRRRPVVAPLRERLA
jgi:hypothetical protein